MSASATANQVVQAQTAPCGCPYKMGPWGTPVVNNLRRFSSDEALENPEYSPMREDSDTREIDHKPGCSQIANHVEIIQSGTRYTG